MGKENEEIRRPNCNSNQTENSDKYCANNGISNTNSNSEKASVKSSDAEEDVEGGSDCRIRSPIQQPLPDLAEGNNFMANRNSSDNPSLCKLKSVTADQTSPEKDPTIVHCGTIEGQCAHGKLNDLVADVVCTNGRDNSGVISDISLTSSGYGDCSNVRATAMTNSLSGYSDHGGFIFNKKSSDTTHMQTPQTQNSSFSFKHFLSSSSSTVTAPSTTVTSLDPLLASSSGTHSTTVTNTTVTSPIATSTAGSSFSSSQVTVSTAATASSVSSATTKSTSASSSYSQQTSTGARPKVPQSASVTTTSISSLTSASNSNEKTLNFGSNNNSDSAGVNGAGGGFLGSKMKRSPRFSSFDSQASLAEYANVVDCGAMGGFGMSCEAAGGLGVSNSDCHQNVASGNSGFRLFPDALTGDNESNSDASKKFGSHSQMRATATRTFGNNDYENQYVPRSYSNYDMMQSSSSPRRRMADAVANVSSKESRPNRLVLNQNNSNTNLKLDLPLDSNATSKETNSNTTRCTDGGKLNLGNYPTDFPPTSALPDFVQDHWMDSLYAHDLHLNSPRNSPTPDINDWASNCSGAANTNRTASNLFGGDTNSASSSSHAPINDILGNGSGISGSPGINIVSNSNAVSGASKMLPDFLSDGPIIHSSQRLADVAAGLPSNPIGSPEETSLATQLTRLRIENERLQHELGDARKALDEQTRRANELERQLQEENRRRATPTAQQVMRLKQQLAQMAEETELLRRENDALREDGAVGGYCDNSGSGARGRFTKPSTSRSQQISQALLRAASNAESNLRQLLAGVDNLRQMAADIENPGLRLDYDGDIDIYSDFLDDCDAYEDFSGGPAL